MDLFIGMMDGMQNSHRCRISIHSSLNLADQEMHGLQRGIRLVQDFTEAARKTGGAEMGKKSVPDHTLCKGDFEGIGRREMDRSPGKGE